MKKNSFLVVAGLVLLIALPALAATPCPPSLPWPPAVGPVVKAVPWVPPAAPTCLIVPHDTISGSTIYLKATTDANAKQYYWDYGDGSPAQSWQNVTNQYDIGVQHVYTGMTGQSYVATVYVKDAATPTPNVNSAKYFVTIRGSSLQVRVNMAIDQGLWRLHREMRSRSGTGGAIIGYWNGGAYTGSGYYSNYAANTTAFLVNGHKPDADLTNPNPYAETALRGMNSALSGLTTLAIPNHVTNNEGTFNPDQNNNGNGTYISQSGQPIYQTGMVMDMVAATGLPDYVAEVGNSGIDGQTLKSILQDMMDFYAYCQNTSGWPEGGWRYTCRSGDSDNSTSQWGAIGMLGGVKQFGLPLPPPIPGPGTSPVILANAQKWLPYSYYNGTFGYTSANYFPWGPYAVTPSGMVQMTMDGITRGTPGNPTMWDHAEDYIRANFSGPLSYWYGLFSFTKSMRLNPGGALTQLCNRDGFPSNNLTNCIDWYNADTANGDPINGVAKTLVNAQYADGYWWGSEQTGEQNYFDTAWAIIMLNQTVFTAGLPVAVIDATPSTVVNNGVVSLTGKNSFHQDPGKEIVQWAWDLSGTGNGPFNVTGVNQNGITIHTNSASFPVSFPVRLQVTDNNTPPETAISTAVITITNPPFPPTANAGGPYSICPQSAYLPYYLNATASTVAPGHAAGTTYPDNVITNYEWDLLGNGTYNLSGAGQSQPRVDDFYAAHSLLGSGSTLLVGLRVTDNSQLSFGSASNLQGTATAQVYLRPWTDQLCTKCVLTAQAIPHGSVPGHPGYIALVWLETGANHYNVYRGTVNGGPYAKIGTVANTILGTGKSMGFSDNGPLVPGTTYYYRIAPATLADVETCQSNQASTSGTLPKGR